MLFRLCETGCAQVLLFILKSKCFKFIRYRMQFQIIYVMVALIKIDPWGSWIIKHSVDARTSRETGSEYQSWVHRSLKSLNRSSLLSEPSFWERWRSIRKRAKSDKRTDIIQILSGSLMSDIRTKERSKNGWKMLKKAWFVHILIKNYTKQRLIVVFSIVPSLFHKLCLLELCEW